MCAIIAYVGMNVESRGYFCFGANARAKHSAMCPEDLVADAPELRAAPRMDSAKRFRDVSHALEGSDSLLTELTSRGNMYLGI